MVVERVPPMLGDNFLAYLTLAIGAALFVGNALALARPRRDEPDGEVIRAPLRRALVQMAIGGLASVWAVATILA